MAYLKKEPVANKDGLILLCCVPGIGASTAVKMFHNDHHVNVVKYNPDISSADNIEDYMDGLRGLMWSMHDDKRYKVILLTHHRVILDALTEAKLDFTLLLPEPNAVEYFQHVCLANKATDGPVLYRNQFMATRFTSVCAEYNRLIENNEVGYQALKLAERSFVTDIIAGMTDYPTTITLDSDDIKAKMRGYIREVFQDVVTSIPCSLALDSHGRIIMRSVDPVADLDHNDVQPNGLYKYAEALGLSAMEVQHTAYLGTGVDFITIQKDDAEALIRILNKTVEEHGGDDVAAFGDDGIAYERLIDRLDGYLYPSYMIKSKMAEPTRNPV